MLLMGSEAPKSYGYRLLWSEAPPPGGKWLNGMLWSAFPRKHTP
jgi:hypothetical protein